VDNYVVHIVVLFDMARE